VVVCFGAGKGKYWYCYCGVLEPGGCFSLGHPQSSERDQKAPCKREEEGRAKEN